ncbi:hypothetical protein MRX96_047187 [Rhipicephalus microplus]
MNPWYFWSAALGALSHHSEHRYIMVLKTSIAAVAMSTLLLLALSSSADAYGCDPSGLLLKMHQPRCLFRQAGNMSLLSLLYTSLSSALSPESWPVWLVQCASLQGGLYCAQMLLSAALSDSTYFLLHATFYLQPRSSTIASGIYLLHSHVNKNAGALAMVTGGVHAAHLCFTVNEHYFKSRGY